MQIEKNCRTTFCRRQLVVDLLYNMLYKNLLQTEIGRMRDLGDGLSL